MTPLAFELLDNLRKPGAFRTTLGDGNIQANRNPFWKAVTEYKFFDLTAVEPLLVQQTNKLNEAFMARGQVNSRLAFLPAPKTWLETRDSRGDRAAYLLHAPTSTADCDVAMLFREDGIWNVSELFPRKLPLIESGARPDIVGHITDLKLKGIYEQGKEIGMGLHFSIYAALALINTPRIIGQRQHMPHERIEREKLKRLGLVGKFPLQAWTELVLKVAPPDDHTGEPATEGHLTGEKCLHFCRTHLRWCAGQLEYVPVEGHWRGNPALGMKRTRYRVEP